MAEGMWSQHHSRVAYVEILRLSLSLFIWGNSGLPSSAHDTMEYISYLGTAQATQCWGLSLVL